MTRQQFSFWAVMVVPARLSLALQYIFWRFLHILEGEVVLSRIHNIWVIYPGADRYVLDKRITAVPIRELPVLLKELDERREA